MKGQIWWIIALTACNGDPSGPSVTSGPGLLGDHILNPFPVGALHLDAGAIALDSADFGIEADQTPLPFERMAWRSGFSVGQTSVVTLPEIRTGALPHWSDSQPGASGVRLFDRSDQEWLPTFAEVDAHPDAEPGTLLIRPLVALTPGHEIAVVLTDETADRPPAFQRLLDTPAPDREDLQSDTMQLLEELDDAGLSADDVALTWSFPVADGTVPLRSAWNQISPVTQITIDSVRESGPDVVPRTFRAAEGTFRTTDFLVDDNRLQLDGATGEVTSTGMTDAVLYVHIPQSVADAAPGTVPVMVFGHGIFANPGLYLDEPDDPSSVVRLADEGGYIVVATTWRGLTTTDAGGAVSAAADFGRIHEVTDKLVQAQANIRSLIDGLAQGDLLDDPVFQGVNGQKLPSDRLVYYGISLGSIEGSVMLANDPPFDAVALHVGGSTWSTMLERSSNWLQFEELPRDLPPLSPGPSAPVCGEPAVVGCGRSAVVRDRPPGRGHAVPGVDRGRAGRQPDLLDLRAQRPAATLRPGGPTRGGHRFRDAGLPAGARSVRSRDRAAAGRQPTRARDPSPRHAPQLHGNPATDPAVPRRRSDPADLWRHGVHDQQPGIPMNPVEWCNRGRSSPIVLACEHASNERHGEWGPDAHLSDQHWAFDPGAAAVTRSLAVQLGAPAVLSQFSRLLVDPNRTPDSPTLFRTEADGRPVQMNQDLTATQRADRIARYYAPYHEAMDELARSPGAALMLSIHSFTPVYEGSVRAVEIGVLFESDESQAVRLASLLQTSTRRDVRLNEPYSGKGGLMYSCDRHARSQCLIALEIELRQDLLATPHTRQELVGALASALPLVLE